MLKEHFAGFLIKTLYGCPCWSQIKPFIGIVKDLASLGCAVPCDMNAFETFALAGVADSKLCSEKFVSSDLTARVRFSAVLSIGTSCSNAPVLCWARSAPTRHEFLQLFMECAMSLEGDTNGDCAKQASWCASLFLTKFQTRTK